MGWYVTHPDAGKKDTAAWCVPQPDAACNSTTCLQCHGAESTGLAGKAHPAHCQSVVPCSACQ